MKTMGVLFILVGVILLCLIVPKWIIWSIYPAILVWLGKKFIEAAWEQEKK